MEEELGELGELSDRIDGLRLALSIAISLMPNRDEVIAKLKLAEALARQRNLPSGVLEELQDLQDTLSQD